MDAVLRAHFTPHPHDSHYTRFPNQCALRVARERCLHEARLDGVELNAGVAQPCHLNDRTRPQTQTRSRGQAQKIHALRRDVLPHIAGPDSETERPQLVVQFGVDEMHLTQVRRVRRFGNARSMLHGPPGMRVARSVWREERCTARTLPLSKTLAPSSTTALSMSALPTPSRLSVYPCDSPKTFG
jgi:hypothetical protein